MSGSVEPVRIGIVGLGRSGMFHVERLGLRDDCRVLAACDADAGARERASGRAFVTDVTWKRLLDHPQIELILIATPPDSRAALAHEALRAGKHVVIDQPMCLTLHEADSLIDTAREAGRMISVAQLRRWDDDFLTARAAIASGSLGGLNMARLIVWQFNPPQARLPRHPGRSAWRDRRETGGGVLWQFGTHYFDQLLQLANEEPVGVFARLMPPDAAGCDEAFLAIVTFASGLLAHVEFNRQSPAPLNTGWMLTGDRGAYSNFTEYTTTAEGEVVDVPLTPLSVPVDEYYSAVFGHLRRGLPNPVTAEQSRRVIALIAAAQQSAMTGETATVKQG